MKSQNKNKYLLFLFSLLPGAAEMYMGLMHMGASLMAAFFASCALFVFFYQFEGLIFVPALLWFYGFFHARNLAGCDEDVFDATEDAYIWDEFFGEDVFRVTRALPRKWGAVALILGGLSLLWDNISNIVENLWNELFGWETGWAFRSALNAVPRIFISLLLIVLGFRLIRGKKVALEQAENSTADIAALPGARQEDAEEQEERHEQ